MAFGVGNFDPTPRLDAEVAYGLDAPRGLLTPYTGLSFSESGETWRAGGSAPPSRERGGESHRTRKRGETSRERNPPAGLKALVSGPEGIAGLSEGCALPGLVPGIVPAPGFARRRDSSS